MNGNRNKNFGDAWIIKESGTAFTLKGDQLKLIADYDFTVTTTTVSEVILGFLNETNLTLPALAKKSARDRYHVSDSLKSGCFLVSELVKPF